MKTITILVIIFFNIWVPESKNLQTKTLLIQATPANFENSINSGKKLFEQNCATCHGLDGTKGKFGAKNLQKSALTDDEYFRIIQKGKGIMPSWEKKLSADQITDIISYLKTLKI